MCTHKHLILKLFLASVISKKCCLVVIYTLIVDEAEYVSICSLAHIPPSEKLLLHILCLFCYFSFFILISRSYLVFCILIFPTVNICCIFFPL